MRKNITIQLDEPQNIELITLASAVGISPERLAQAFVSDGITSFKYEPDELRNTFHKSETAQIVP